MYVTDHRHIRAGRSLAQVRIPYQWTMARDVLRFTERAGRSVAVSNVGIQLALSRSRFSGNVE
jgi:hypothetical protein